MDWARACSRAYWRFAHKYAYPRNSGLTPIIQMGAMTIVLFYCMNYSKFSKFEDSRGAHRVQKLLTQGAPQIGYSSGYHVVVLSQWEQSNGAKILGIHLG